jgi:Peptidase family C25/Concanavalin A-like lectin/glucanases superfamily/Domain of unknown function (DUF2341)/Propeptide_C25
MSFSRVESAMRDPLRLRGAASTESGAVGSSLVSEAAAARLRRYPVLAASILFVAIASIASAQNVKVGSFTKTTGLAPIAQVVPHGLGQTPVALILWTDGKTNAAFSTNFLYAFGMTDGTTSKAIAAASRSNNSVPLAGRRLASKAISMVDWTPAVVAEADLQSWSFTSFTLNWTTNNATATVIHFIAIGGPGVSAKVLNWTMRTATGNESVSGIGFTPDVVLHAHAGDGFTASPPSNSTGAHFGLGAMDKTGGQWATDVESVNGLPSVTTRGQQTNACIYGFNSSRVAVKKASFVSMDADGFTVDFTTANANASQVISLALKGVAAKAGSFLKSTTLPPATAYVQSQTFSTTTNVASANVLLPATTAGDLIVVSVDFHQPAVVSSVVDDKGNTYRRALGPTNWGPSPDRMYTYYAKNITGGSATITVSLSGGSSNGWIELFASEYRGIDATDPLDQSSEATGSGGNPMASGTLTTTSPDELLYGACGADTGTITLTAPFTTRRNPNGNPVGDASVSSIGTYNLSSSIDDAGAWTCQMLSFRHAGVKQSVSSVGFSPDAMLLASFQDVAQASPVAQARLGVGAMDASFNQGASAVADRDAVSPTSVQGIDKTSRAFMKVDNNSSTVDAEAVPYSMDSDGFTLDWTTNDAVGTQILYLALGTLKASSYSRFRTITVPAASLGASCTTSLTNFPLLVSLSNDLELRTVADGGYVQNANGYDIVFTDANDNVLDHEIEQYTSAPGGANLVAWVRVPTLSVLGPTTLGMQYGNASVSSPTANPAGVWDSSYKAVWHLKETATGAAGEYRDSTSYGNHGQGGAGTAAAVPTRVAGRMGFGQSFDGANDFIDGGTDASLDITGPITLEAWVQLSSPNPGGTSGAQIVGKGTNGQYRLYQDWDLDERITFHVNTPSPDWVETPGSLSLNTWYYAVGTYDGSYSTLYVNGAQIDRQPVGSPIIAEPGLPVWMGADGSPAFFNGPEDEVRISGTARSKCWIETEYNNENNPGGFVTLGGATSTAVELMSFGATGGDGEVDLSWETGSETHNLGFHLHRSLSASGPFLRITAVPIPGLGSSPEGARYAYRDPDLANGTTYFYELEDIETTGETALHGPVSATPRAGASNPAPPSSSSGLTYGEPAKTSVQVTRQSSREMVLELRTEGFTLERQPDGSVEISLPGFLDTSEPGAPAIPVKRSWLPTPAGRGVRIASVSAEDVETFSSMRPAAEGSPELVATRQGTVRPRRRAGREGAAFRGAGMFPESLARVVSEGYQGDEKKTLLELAPLRWNRSTGELSLAKRLTVRLVFTGGERVSRRAETARRSRSVARRLVTRERGLYGVSYEEIFGRGRAVAASSLRLSRLGDRVAFHLEPDPGMFGPGSRLYFVSDGASSNPYGNEAVYELESSSSGTEMATASSAPSHSVGEPRVSFYWKEVSREENVYYQAGLLEAEDPWLWDVLLAPMTKSYSFEVSALVSAGGEPARLSVWLQGASDLPESPDHHVRVGVNGIPVLDSTFEGKSSFHVTAAIPEGALREGQNELDIENVGDTEAAYSMVMLDRFAVAYPRRLVAEAGVLEGRFSQSGVVEVEGLSGAGGALVLDATEKEPRWLCQSSRFHVDAGRSYLVVSSEAVSKPELERVPVATLESSRQGADYLILAPKEFLPAVEPLLELRRAQGLRSRGVSMEDVDSEFGFGESRPEAVKAFLSYAYQNWQKPAPRYVLLFGDATYDFKDYLGTGVKNEVPPLLVKTSYLWTASDPEYAAVHGDDDLPDFAIGRLPAASVDEARVMVEKILAYESTGSLSRGPMVLVADDADAAGDFEADAERIASSLPSPRTIYLSRLGTERTHREILEAFDEGASLLSYVGHGGIQLWAQENMFNSSDVSELAPQSQQPFVLTFNCLNGYFQFPYFNSLAEELVKADGKGAIAAFSPSGLSLDEPAQLFQSSLLKELLSGKNRRLGDAVLAAQSSYAASGVYPELLIIYHLLGDPALTVR